MEFLVLAGFMLLVLTSFVLIVRERGKAEIVHARYQEFATTASIIAQEVALANSVENGYVRTFELPMLINNEPYTVRLYGSTEISIITASEEYVIYLPVNVTILDSAGGSIDFLAPGKNTISKRDNNITIRPAITELVTCQFTSVQSASSCFANVGGSCSINALQTECQATNSGANPQTVVWSSSCDPSTRNTYLDGNPETIVFNCVAPTVYSIAADRSTLFAVQAQTVSIDITATPVSGTQLPVTFTVSGLPAGTNASFSQASCTPSCTTGLSIYVAPGTVVGTYPITVSTDDVSTVFNLQVEPGLIGWWKFDEVGVSATAADSSGFNKNGVVQNGPVTWVSGRKSNALQLSGASQSVLVMDSYQPRNYTVSAWVKPASTANQNIFLRTSASGPLSAWSHVMRTSSSRFQHYTYDGAGKTVTGTTVIVPDVWYHVVIVAGNAVFARLYVNGVEQGTPLGVGTLWALGDRYFIGSISGGSIGYFSGVIDDVMLFNRSLNATEVRQIYTNVSCTGVSTQFCGVSAIPNSIPGSGGCVSGTCYTCNTGYSYDGASCVSTTSTFTLSGTSVSVGRGFTATSTITATQTAGIAGPITFSTGGALPTGVTASFSPTSCTPSSTSPFTCTVTMTVSTTTATPPGSYQIQVLGNGATSTNVPLTVNDDLLGYWTFNEGTGSTAADSSGHGFTGTLWGGASWGAGRSGNALFLTVGSQYVAINTLSGSKTGPFTVSAWLRPTASTAAYTFIGSNGPDYGFEAKMQSGTQIMTSIGTGTSWITRPASSYSWSANNWYHVTYVIDTTGYRAYVNGVQVGTGTYAGTPLLYDGTHSLVVGYTGHTIFQEFFKGNIDELKIYNRALTAAEVSQVYTS